MRKKLFVIAVIAVLLTALAVDNRTRAQEALAATAGKTITLSMEDALNQIKKAVSTQKAAKTPVPEKSPEAAPVRAPEPTPVRTPAPTPRPVHTTKPGTQTGASAKRLTVGSVIKGTLTYYCPCSHCCGSHVKEIGTGVYRSRTASGITVQTGQAPSHPIVSCNWLPLGSRIEVNGVVYTVEDRGGSSLNKVGRLDVYVYRGHAAAKKMGMQKGVSIKILRIGR
ncbi:MAG: hypothetical protein ACOYU3_00910 [Bacillota bacterium]